MDNVSLFAVDRDNDVLLLVNSNFPNGLALEYSTDNTNWFTVPTSLLLSGGFTGEGFSPTGELMMALKAETPAVSVQFAGGFQSSTDEYASVRILCLSFKHRCN